MPGDEDARFEYLRYVFPSLDEHGTCEPLLSSATNGYVGMSVMWDCELGSSLIRYRYWQRTSDADKHYGRKFTKNTRTAYKARLEGSKKVLSGWAKEKQGLQVNTRTGTSRYALTIWMPDYHLSLSAEGDTRADMRQALKLARIRVPEQMRGYPLGGESEPVGFILSKR